MILRIPGLCRPMHSILAYILNHACISSQLFLLIIIIFSILLILMCVHGFLFDDIFTTSFSDSTSIIQLPTEVQKLFRFLYFIIIFCKSQWWTLLFQGTFEAPSTYSLTGLLKGSTHTFFCTRNFFLNYEVIVSSSQQSGTKSC